MALAKAPNQLEVPGGRLIVEPIQGEGGGVERELFAAGEASDETVRPMQQ